MLHSKVHETHQETPLKHMTTRTSLRPAAERVSPLREAVTTALDDMKAANVRVLDVRGLTDIADTMVIASGNSDRHVRSIAERVVEKARRRGSGRSAPKARATVSGCWSISRTSSCT